MNERGFWTEKEEIDTHMFDGSLCAALIKGTDKNLTWVDIGCGNGSYTMELRNAGINCIGYDGSPLTEEITNGICKTLDFSKPQNIGKFDVVLSLEVGEHIPEEYEDIFIDNLVRASRRIIVMSWAVEGQPGTGHVNCRNNDYIIRKMSERGFMYAPMASQILRDASTLPWFKNTILIFNLW